MYTTGAQVEFSQSYYVVGEEEGWVEVEVIASGPSDTSYTVQVTTKSGSADSKRNNTCTTHTHTANTPAGPSTNLCNVFTSCTLRYLKLAIYHTIILPALQEIMLEFAVLLKFSSN